MKQHHFLSVAAFAASTLLAVPAATAQTQPLTEDIASYRCKDIVRLSGVERDTALAVLHGYMLGKKGATSFVPADLGKVSDDFVEHCLDHPADNVLKTFEKFAK